MDKDTIYKFIYINFLVIVTIYTFYCTFIRYKDIKPNWVKQSKIPRIAPTFTWNIPEWSPSYTIKYNIDIKKNNIIREIYDNTAIIHINLYNTKSLSLSYNYSKNLELLYKLDAIETNLMLNNTIVLQNYSLHEAELTVKYYISNSKYYDSILWFDAASEITLYRDVLQLIQYLNINIYDTNIDTMLIALSNILILRKKSILIIYSNINDISTIKFLQNTFYKNLVKLKYHNIIHLNSNYKDLFRISYISNKVVLSPTYSWIFPRSIWNKIITIYAERSKCTNIHLSNTNLDTFIKLIRLNENLTDAISFIIRFVCFANYISSSSSISPDNILKQQIDNNNGKSPQIHLTYIILKHIHNTQLQTLYDIILQFPSNHLIPINLYNNTISHNTIILLHQRLSLITYEILIIDNINFKTNQYIRVSSSTYAALQILCKEFSLVNFDTILHNIHISIYSLSPYDTIHQILYNTIYKKSNLLPTSNIIQLYSILKYNNISNTILYKYIHLIPYIYIWENFFLNCNTISSKILYKCNNTLLCKVISLSYKILIEKNDPYKFALSILHLTKYNKLHYNNDKYININISSILLQSISYALCPISYEFGSSIINNNNKQINDCKYNELSIQLLERSNILLSEIVPKNIFSIYSKFHLFLQKSNKLNIQTILTNTQEYNIPISNSLYLLIPLQILIIDPLYPYPELKIININDLQSTPLHRTFIEFFILFQKYSDNIPTVCI